MQIKTSMRYCLTPVRMAIIKRQGITNVGKDVEKKEPFSTLLVEIQSGSAAVATVWRFLNKLNIDNSTPRYIHKRIESKYSNQYM